jgi:hypothetical protein
MAQGDTARTTNREGDGSWKEKVWPLVIDKLVLGSIAAALVYFFTAQQRHSQMAMEYQRTLFDSRRGAYVALLTNAKEARDTAALFLGSRLYPAPSTLADKDYSWRLRLAELRQRLNSFHP